MQSIYKLNPCAYSLLRWQVGEAGIIEAFPKDEFSFYLKSYSLENMKVRSKWNAGSDSNSISELLSIKCTVLAYFGLNELTSIQNNARKVYYNDKSFVNALDALLEGIELIPIKVSKKELDDQRELVYNPGSKKNLKFKKRLIPNPSINNFIPEQKELLL